MKICWDNLEKLRYSKKTNKWYRGTSSYIYKEKCKGCGNPFLSAVSSIGNYCDNKCQLEYSHPMKGKKHSKESKKKMSRSAKENLKDKKNHPMYGKKHTKETIQKIKENQPNTSGKNNSFYGKKHSEETRKRISSELKKLYHNKENHPSWKGGYDIKNIPFYDTYISQINYVEECKRNQEDPNILEVKCTWCGKWFIPKKTDVRRRIQSLIGQLNGECRFYCSNGCKENCPIYNKTPETLMKEDAVRAGRLSWLELNREVQPELRQMVFERDGWKCIKCGEIEGLHCHHIEGIRWNPLESADIDMVITVCSNCHKEIHQKEGCGYNDMKCKEI